MKKIDKLLQIKKANILAEQRYFESKGLIKEEDGSEDTHWKSDERELDNEDIDIIIIDKEEGETKTITITKPILKILIDDNCIEYKEEYEGGKWVMDSKWNNKLQNLIWFKKDIEKEYYEKDR
jgi:hypothetical protein